MYIVLEKHEKYYIKALNQNNLGKKVDFDKKFNNDLSPQRLFI